MYKTQDEEELEAPYCILFLRIRCNEGPIMRRTVHLKYMPAIALRQKRRILLVKLELGYSVAPVHTKNDHTFAKTLTALV